MTLSKIDKSFICWKLLGHTRLLGTLIAFSNIVCKPLWTKLCSGKLCFLNKTYTYTIHRLCTSTHTLSKVSFLKVSKSKFSPSVKMQWFENDTFQSVILESVKIESVGLDGRCPLPTAILMVHSFKVCSP